MRSGKDWVRLWAVRFLKLRSEELLEQGEARGRLTGLREGRLTGLHEAKIDAIQNMIDLGLTREQILRKYSPEEDGVKFFL